MHDGVGECGTKLSPSLQVLGHGFVLATVPKQQTASVGKGHKKFSSPLLKPSGSYKKKPNWLVEMVGSTSSLLCFPSISREHGGTPSVTSTGHGLPCSQDGGSRQPSQCKPYFVMKKLPWHPFHFISPYLSQMVPYEEPGPPNGFSRSEKPIGQIGPHPARGIIKPAGEVGQGQ